MSGPRETSWLAHWLRRPDAVIAVCLLVPLSLLFVVVAWLSLEWRMVHDFPLLHYFAFQMDRFGSMPYRDIFETSMPGVFLFHLAVGKLFGYGDLAVRCVDLALLLSLLALTADFMRRISARVAWAGCVLFGLVYLAGGTPTALQRDYLGLIPIALGLWLAVAGAWSPRQRALGVGLSFGVAVCFKPHLGIGLPLVLAYLWADAPREPQSTGARSPATDAVWILLPAALGLIVPIGACLTWLAWHGVLGEFWEMFSSYLPLHLQLNGEHRMVGGWARVVELVEGLRELDGRGLWLAPAFVGMILGLVDAPLSARQRRGVWLLAGLTAVYAIYPAIAGQFWSYHWMPFQYFVALAAALAAIPLAASAPPLRRALPMVLLAIFVFFQLELAPESRRQFDGKPLKLPGGGATDALAELMRDRLEPGDTVQSLSWVRGGVTHAMLLAEARAATRYVYDYHFYHHVSSPVIQRMRREFVEQLEAARPRLIIRVPERRVSGRDTTTEFSELEAFLAQSYTEHSFPDEPMASQHPAWTRIIYERKTSAP